MLETVQKGRNEEDEDGEGMWDPIGKWEEKNNCDNSGHKVHEEL